jgi:hypothetical protein
MPSSSSNQEVTVILPYRAWWGLLACAGFMVVIGLFAPFSAGINFPPDQPGFYYYWVRPDPSVLTRLSAWIPYVIHQVAIWYLISVGRKQRPAYIFGLHRFNVMALGVNTFFILLHIVQTKVFYDGLAQDVPEMTAVMSVTLMIFLIMLMENRRRGLFFGKPVGFLNQVGDVVKRHHGYFFSWAMIYTFWYHPIEITPGHLAGTFYMALLLLQSSLFFTKYHTNHWWKMSLELAFVFHGAVVVYFLMSSESNMAHWSVFLFGGLAAFLVTQLHGLGLNRSQKWMFIIPIVVLGGSYFMFNPQYFSGALGQLVARYAGVFVLFGLLWLVLKPLGLLPVKKNNNSGVEI